MRADNLKRLEIPLDDILHATDEDKPFQNAIKVCLIYLLMKFIIISYLQEISNLLGKPWSPLQSTQLHPVILDPTAGDSDEYLMPILLGDLY